MLRYTLFYLQEFVVMDESAMWAATHDDVAGTTLPELDNTATGSKKHPDFQRANHPVHMPVLTNGICYLEAD